MASVSKKSQRQVHPVTAHAVKKGRTSHVTATSSNVADVVLKATAILSTLLIMAFVTLFGVPAHPGTNPDEAACSICEDNKRTTTLNGLELCDECRETFFEDR